MTTTIPYYPADSRRRSAVSISEKMTAATDRHRERVFVVREYLSRRRQSPTGKNIAACVKATGLPRAVVVDCFAAITTERNRGAGHG